MTGAKQQLPDVRVRVKGVQGNPDGTITIDLNVIDNTSEKVWTEVAIVVDEDGNVAEVGGDEQE